MSEEETRTPVAAGESVEGKRRTGVSTGSTEATTHVKSLSDRLQHLSVSPPRRRDSPQGDRVSSPTVPITTSSAMRASTPPPNVPPPRTSSKPATPVDSSGSLGLPRNRSSPSLLDASPKSASGAPPRSSSRRSPRQTSPAVQPAVRHHELTPVTRNTSDAGQFVDDKAPGAVVSPEEKLHGEHLALPSGDDYASPAGLQQPPLQQRAMSSEEAAAAVPSTTGPPFLPVAARARSLGNLEMQRLAQTARMSELQRMAMNYSFNEEEEEERVVGDPVQFPSRKIYSFTSGQQYKAAVEEERGAFESVDKQNIFAGAAAGLTPYQPSRSDSWVGMDREETSQIFTSRHVRGASSEDSSRNLQNAIPLEERQWSIPSIRMANHVQGSTQSYTDEEDDLFRGYDDDASLSSRGSSLYLPEEGVSTTEAPTLRLGHAPASFHHSAPVVIEDGMDRVFHVDLPDSSAVAVAVAPQEQQEQQQQEPPRQERRKKRTKKHNDKEREAYEWLRTVELGPENNVFCEAASSKFLTSGTKITTNPPLNRTDSSPATISRYSSHHKA